MSASPQCQVCEMTIIRPVEQRRKHRKSLGPKVRRTYCSPECAKEAKLLRNRNREFVRRLTRKLKQLCQRCPNDSPKHALCALCRQKDLAKKPKAFEDFDEQRALKNVHIGGQDRKHNGNYSKALDWALIMHREAHVPDYTIH